MQSIFSKAFHLFAGLLLSFQSFSQISKDQLNISQPHPRILLYEQEEKQLINSIQSDETWNMLHLAMLNECERLLSIEPVKRIQIGRRLLDKSREALRRIFMLSYAWRTTKDDRFFVRAEKELLDISAFSDWNPSHFLDVAEMTMAAAIGYDWLYP
ncbi:MAG: hypothetical protein RLZZ42_116, partial [Bacteroidota bacterium]